MSLSSPLITFFDIGMMGMADALVETVASSSPANPINSAVFDMTHISSLRYGFTLACQNGVLLPVPGRSRRSFG